MAFTVFALFLPGIIIVGSFFIFTIAIGVLVIYGIFLGYIALSLGFDYWVESLEGKEINFGFNFEEFVSGLANINLLSFFINGFVTWIVLEILAFIPTVILVILFSVSMVIPHTDTGNNKLNEVHDSISFGLLIAIILV